MRFIRTFLRVIIICTLSTSAMAQSALDDSSMRHEIASRIANDYGVRVDWQRTGLLDLMDMEARLNNVKRIKSEFGTTFNWRKTSSLELMDAESRTGAARRISKLTKKPVNWKQYTLMQLMEMEAWASGVDVDAIKRQVTSAASQSRSLPRVSGRGLSVYVIAPSVSTSIEARSIRRKNGWSESRLRQAGAILVVVRSTLSNPLDYSYDSVKELEDDADSQLNIAGGNFHVYIYSIDEDMEVSREKHISYKVDD